MPDVEVIGSQPGPSPRQRRSRWFLGAAIVAALAAVAVVGHQRQDAAGNLQPQDRGLPLAATLLGAGPDDGRGVVAATMTIENRGKADVSLLSLDSQVDGLRLASARRIARSVQPPVDRMPWTLPRHSQISVALQFDVTNCSRAVASPDAAIAIQVRAAGHISRAVLQAAASGARWLSAVRCQLQIPTPPESAIHARLVSTDPAHPRRASFQFAAPSGGLAAQAACVGVGTLTVRITGAGQPQLRRVPCLPFAATIPSLWTIDNPTGTITVTPTGRVAYYLLVSS